MDHYKSIFQVGTPKNKRTNISSHPDYTVGFGIAPNQPSQKRNSSWTLTTGRELHPAPKMNYILLYYSRIVPQAIPTCKTSCSLTPWNFSG